MTVDRPHIRVDPAQRFGRPNIRGISCEAIAGMVMAGEDATSVAADYGLTRHEVLLACWHEAVYGPPRFRRAWKQWATAVQPKLGGWEPFDPDTEPGPPDKHDLKESK